MHPIKITDVNEIKNPQLLETTQTLEEGEVVLVFSNGTFTKISDRYEGVIKTMDDKTISLNPINMNWRPIWVGIRLFNTDMRTMRQLYFQDVTYITHYIQNDIIK